jgi:hypothetical protein
MERKNIKYIRDFVETFQLGLDYPDSEFQHKIYAKHRDVKIENADDFSRGGWNVSSDNEVYEGLLRVLGTTPGGIIVEQDYEMAFNLHWGHEKYKFPFEAKDFKLYVMVEGKLVIKDGKENYARIISSLDLLTLEEKAEAINFYREQIN